MADETSSMDVESTTPETTTVKKVEPSASAETASKFPDMSLAQRIHRMTMCCGEKPILDADGAVAAKVPSDLLEVVIKEVAGEGVENPSLYRHLTSLVKSSGPSLLSEQELTAMDTKHKETMEGFAKKEEEAKESAGDMEVLDAKLEAARFAAKSLSKEEAINAYGKVISLPKLSSGKKIDALMECSRVASFYGDEKKNEELLDQASKLAGDGGDWDRRNRLKVFTALSKILERNMKEAAGLLIDCIATFSCSELCSYSDFIVYTIITNILHLPRTDLKEKIIDGPEILSVKNDIPQVIRLVNALYECDYKAYLHAMVEVQPILVADRFLQPHSGYIMRELHVLGYKQFLDSYKSVTLESMAQSFGVGKEYLDLQLSRFIAAGRLTAKIDKFGGVVETNRPDLKNAQYRDMIQHGDLLLNRIQKLARVVDL